VKKYMSSLLVKLGAENRVQAALLAQTWGLS
jgi:DNA-binding NarL/FixJ family response regulator